MYLLQAVLNAEHVFIASNAKWCCIFVASSAQHVFVASNAGHVFTVSSAEHIFLLQLRLNMFYCL